MINIEMNMVILVLERIKYNCFCLVFVEFVSDIIFLLYFFPYFLSILFNICLSNSSEFLFVNIDDFMVDKNSLKYTQSLPQSLTP